MAFEEYKGKVFDPVSLEVEKGRIKLFAKAIGEENPIYTDEEAAKSAGYRGIPMPPTMPFAAIMDHELSFNMLKDMGVNLLKAMHAEQGYTYHGEICAGDVLTGSKKITDVYDKKDGALQFIVTEMPLNNQNGDHVCDLHTVVVVRNG